MLASSDRLLARGPPPRPRQLYVLSQKYGSSPAPGREGCSAYGACASRHLSSDLCAAHESPNAGRLHPGGSCLVEPREHLRTHPERRHPDHVPLPGATEHAPQPRELVRVDVHLFVAAVASTRDQSRDDVLAIAAAQVPEEFGDHEV